MANLSDKLKDIVDGRRNRRKFLIQTGLAALGALSLSQATGFTSVAEAAQGENASITDVNILNFALNLEYLEADANGLAYSRNLSQVLSIVYLGGTDRGGFFPNGVNALSTA